MVRFYFSIYDRVAESYAEPFCIPADDKVKACKIAMRSIAKQDLEKSLIPVEDLQLYLVGVFNHGRMATSYLGDDCDCVLVCDVSELYKKEEVNNG